MFYKVIDFLTTTKEDRKAEEEIVLKRIDKLTKSFNEK